MGKFCLLHPVYIKMSCASHPVAKIIHGTQNLGKAFPFHNSVASSPQNLGHFTTAGVHVFFETPGATVTHWSQAGCQRMPAEDVSHHKPHHSFASSANSSSTLITENSFIKNCPHKSLQFIYNSSHRKKRTQPTLSDQCM